MKVIIYIQILVDSIANLSYLTVEESLYMIRVDKGGTLSSIISRHTNNPSDIPS